MERLEPPLPRLAALVEDPSLVIDSAVLEEYAARARHVLRLTPGDEIEIVCTRVETTMSPVPGQDYFDAGPRFDILSC